MVRQIRQKRPWVWILAGSFLLPFHLLSEAVAGLPPEAVALLERLPEKRLTLEVISAFALKSSDTYTAQVASKIEELNVPRLQARGALQTQLIAEGNFLDNRTEASNQFAPNRIGNKGLSLGVSTSLLTGTRFQAKIAHSSQSLHFSTFTLPDFFETKAILEVSQDLWRNAFGYQTRRQLLSGELLTLGKSAEIEEAQEQWFLQLAQLFYDSWLAQAQTQAALDNLKRRERLLKITLAKANRGTAEEPDVLQVKSSLLFSEVQFTQAEIRLKDKWRGLVAALNLPKSFQDIPPLEIPLSLDTPFQITESACGSEKQINPEPKETASTRMALANSQAANLALEAAHNGMKPSLQLGLGLESNGIDTQSRGTSAEESLRVFHPAWKAGLTLTVPLANSPAEATLEMAKANKLRADALSSLTQTSKGLNWDNLCHEFFDLQNSHKKLTEAFKNQQRRLDLEEKRFSLGRSPTLQVIQAGDDATQSEQELRRSEVQRRIVAWRVLQLTGTIKSYLEQRKDFTL